ncbi:T9SS type A sorting domain-containing protein [Lentimicrobium sp. L6]|uniref:T9SS type A sorting domain-containing protein n=1 Tax=Lentimicrobium sp. L6 TaxID=2735916 RepID=UPI001554E831|nr:T9SS type A sorting domain-containing protein [Lentimicrobium sp. L6]NPD84208.1 T9SS type A sorting domain-containing protein [Lentimicrobium sp. L6]
MKKYILVIGFLLSLISFSEDIMAQKAEQAKERYSFGGHVFTKDFPIKIGQAVLYNALTNERLDDANIDTLGYYYFYRKPAGDYLVLARLLPEDPNFSAFSSTYYPNNAFWQEAEVIHLTETSWEYDIDMVVQQSEGSPNGPGKISGTIFQISGKPFVADVDVIIFDENMESVVHYPTNEFGQFNFENLEYGTYVLFPQIIGMTTNPIEIIISPEHAVHQEIEISIEDGYISSSINEALISEESFRFFPNPASSLINIQFNTSGNKNIQTRISDLSGRVVFEESAKLTSSDYSNTLTVGDWQNGYYILEILIDGSLASTQKLVISH